MAEINVGNILKQLREKQQLTREQLAEGICSVDQLLNYERGNIHPRVDELCSFAEKLNIEVTYFFDVSDTVDFSLIEGVQKIIRKYIRERNYKAVWEILKKESKSPVSTNTYYLQFLKWHEGICSYHLFNNVDVAISTLYTAYEMKNKSIVRERDIEILNSIALIYHKTGQFETAIKVLREALELIEEMYGTKDNFLKIRIYHSLSQTLNQVGSYKIALKYSLKGIDLCIFDETMYLFGELHYSAGESFIKSGEFKKGLDFLKKAKIIFELQKNANFVSLVEKEESALLDLIAAQN